MRNSIVTVLGPTAPVYDLTTVDDVNDALNITGNTADDARMAEKITRTSKMIAELCYREFALLTVQESFRVRWGEPVEALYLRQYPVTQLISITHGNDWFGGGTVPDPSQYELDYEGGLLWMKCWRWLGEVTVEYTGGYDLPGGAPALLQQACIETIRAQRFAANRDPALRDIQSESNRVSYFDYYQQFGVRGPGAISVLPPNITAMIQPYKWLGVV